MTEIETAGRHALDAHLMISALRPEPAWRAQNGALCHDAAAEMSDRGFDFAPVQSPETTGTYFCSLADLRSAASSSRVEAVARPVDPNQRLKPTAALRDLRKALAEHEFVVIEDTLGGIGVLTCADLAHPAVSSSVFHTLMVLEQGLSALLELFDDPELLAAESLGAPAIERIQTLVAERQRRNLELSFVRSMTLEDRFDVIAANAEIWAQIVQSKNHLKRWKKNAQRLRNVLAHSGSLLDVDSDPLTVLTLVDELELLAENVWACVDDPVWTRYAFAEVRTPNGDVVAGRGALKDTAVDRWVITADNPGGSIIDSSAENFSGEQHNLRQRLIKLGCDFIEGSGGRLKHWEHSFIIEKLSQDEVLRLAKEFGQIAVFKLTPESQILIRSSDAAEVRCIPRCR